MTHTRTMRLVAVAVGVLGLAGCPVDEPFPIPLEAGSATQAITSDYDALANGVAQALSFLNNSGLVKDSLPQNCTVASPAPDGGAPVESCSSVDLDLNAPARDSSSWLKDHLFNEAHLSAEQTTAARLVFCLRGDDLCVVNQLGPDGGSTSLDSACVKMFTDVPICVAVTSPKADAYDIELLIGANPATNPADFHIQPDRVAAEVMLADVKAAFEAITIAGGDSIPEGFPKRLAGVVAGELSKTGEKAYAAKLSVPQQIEVDLYDATDVRRTEIRVNAAPALLAVAFDGIQKLVDGSVDLGAVNLKLAADLMFGSSTTTCEPPPVGCTPPCNSVCTTVDTHYTGAFLSSLAGLSGRGRFQAGATKDTLDLTGLGIGDGTSRVSFLPQGSAQPTQILGADLNASQPTRRFDVSISHDVSGTTFKVSPLLDLLVDHDFQVLASQFTDITGWALKAISRIRFSGNEPTLLLTDATDTQASQIQVLSGLLELDASGMLDAQPDVSLDVAASQCLVDLPGPFTGDEHPFSQVTSGVCSF